MLLIQSGSNRRIIQMKTADLHCDTLSALRRIRKEGENRDLLSNSLHIDLQRLKKGNYILQTFALFTDAEEEKNQREASLEMLRIFREEMEKNRDQISQVITWEDIRSNMETGRISALLSIEDGEVTAGNDDFLIEYRNAGVRLMTLTWNYENSLGWPHCDPASQNREKEHGLKDKGIETLERMEELGIIPDVSHLGDSGFFRLAEVTKKPFIASHSNARSLCGHSRNLTDEMIRIIGERGGLIGLNLYPPFIRMGYTMPDKPVELEEISAHARHIMDIGGSEVLGLGSDFDGIDCTPAVLRDCSCMPLLAEHFLQQGFSEMQTEKIFHGNTLRFLKENLS